jgi:hypothetical protein
MKETPHEHIIRRARERYGLILTMADVLDLEQRLRQAREVLGDLIGREHAYNGAYRTGESSSEGSVYGEKWRIRIRGVELRAVWLMANGGRLVTLYWPPDAEQKQFTSLGQVARIGKLKKKY